jgi:transposase-like protein
MRNPYRYFNSSPEVIRLTVMLYIRSPLSLRQVEDLLFEPGIDICHETVRALVVPIRPDVRRNDPEQAIGGSVATCAARPA